MVNAIRKIMCCIVVPAHGVLSLFPCQLVDSRAFLASIAPPAPPPKSAAEVAAAEQTAALLDLEAQREAEHLAKIRKREETNTDDAAVNEAFPGLAVKQGVARPMAAQPRRSGIIDGGGAWEVGKPIGARLAARVKSGGLGGYEYKPAWGGSSEAEEELQVQMLMQRRRNLLTRSGVQENTVMATSSNRSTEAGSDSRSGQRRLQKAPSSGRAGGTGGSVKGAGVGVRTGVYAAASKRAAGTAQLRGASSAGQQAAAALAASRVAALEWAAAQPGYQPPHQSPWLKEAKHRLDRGPPPPIGAARGGGYGIGAGSTGSRSGSAGNVGLQGASFLGDDRGRGQPVYPRVKVGGGGSSSSPRSNGYSIGRGFSRGGGADLPPSAEAAAREARKAAFLEAHARRRQADTHHLDVLAAEAASGGDGGDGRLPSRAARMPSALHWQAKAAAGGAAGRVQVVVVAAADSAWRGLALNWCLGLERVR
jgi:hypothetical protein